MIYEVFQFQDNERNIRYKIVAKEKGMIVGVVDNLTSEDALTNLHEFKRNSPQGQVEWPKVPAVPTGLENLIKAFENGWYTLHKPAEPSYTTSPTEVLIP